MSTPHITPATPSPKQPYNRWTADEEAILRKFYVSHGPAHIATLLNRSKHQCGSKGKQLGLLRGHRGAPWSEAEKARLVEYYPTHGGKATAELLGRPVDSVLSMAKQLEVRCELAPRGVRWTEQDRALLIEHYAAGTPLPELAALLGRPVSHVVAQAGTLRLRRPGRPARPGIARRVKQMWTPEEEEALRRLWPTASRGEILAALPNRTANTIWPHALRTLRLGKRARAGSWTDSEKEIMRAEYPKHGAKYVARLLGRSVGAVNQAAVTLSVKRSRAEMLRVARDRPDAWTLAHDALLQEHYPAGMPVHRLAHLLGRTKTATQHRVATLKLYRAPQPKAPAAERTPKPRPATRTAAPPVVKPPRAVKPAKPAKPAKVAKAPKPVAVAKPAPVAPRGWTPEADAQLVALFPDLELEQLAEQLGRGVYTVKARAQELKLKKSEAYLAAREAAQAEARLIKKKAKAQVEKKQKKEPAAAPKKWWQYHMSTPEYKAGLAATTAGRVPVSGIDSQGRPTTTWRKRETLSQAA